ncbi:MAG: polysaccharide biosynthesis C-terminal domain-containing protein [Actinomycetota bacterium]|nr:polysaccharide biosynthesis C-terminal domain-containing protein [Actinomycetota bacterium]
MSEPRGDGGDGGHPPGTAGGAEDTGAVLRRIGGGLSWNTTAQAATVVLNLGLTPFLLTRLGVDRYGIFALTASFRGLLSNLDGGLGPTAYRYFAVHAGSGDRRATSSLLATMLVLTALVVGLVTGASAIFAPGIMSLVHASPALRESGALLVREYMPIMFVGALRAMFQRIVMANHRWAYYNGTVIASEVVYVGLAFALVDSGLGLSGLVLAFAGSEAVALVSAVAGAWHFVDVRHMRLARRSELRDLLRFSSRVQIAEVASSFNFEIDALIVGLIFPVRYVSFYSIGSNVSSQLAGLPGNALPPISVTLSRTFGRSTLRDTLDEFVAIQRMWVRTIAAFPLVAAVAVLFGVDRWLGGQAELAGVVAAILLVGQSPLLYSGVMDTLGKAANRPGLESRYLGVGMAVNIPFTVGLAFGVGMLGVPIGTGLGQMASSVYFLRIARRQIAPDLRSFVPDFPVVPVLLSLAATAALEFGAFAIAPRGAVGLLVCALPAVVGLAVYAMALLGWNEGIARARDGLRAVRARAGARRGSRPDGGETG